MTDPAKHPLGLTAEEQSLVHTGPAPAAIRTDPVNAEDDLVETIAQAIAHARSWQTVKLTVGDWDDRSKGERQPFMEMATAALEAVRSTRDSEIERGALVDVATERRRQIEAEGWTSEHDDAHGDFGDLALAAASYARSAASPGLYHRANVPPEWPWDREWWKPGGRRRDLVKAAALLVAEIERLDRQALNQGTDNVG